MNSENQDTGEQPRPPRNFQDMLRYAVEAGSASANTPPNENQSESLDPERRQFLEGAINSLAVDVAKILTESIETLKGVTKDTLAPEVFENSLDSIADYVDNIDAANDFVKLGGFSIVNNCLQSHHPGIRWRIADIIAQCTQNNPCCQNLALDLKLLEPLISMADKDGDERCKTKAFFAVSNIVRDSADGIKEFMRLNGFSAVKKAMTSDTERLRSKSAFFFSACVAQHPNIIWDVASMGFPELLVSLLQKEANLSQEYVASSLLVILQENREALDFCKKTELKLKEILQSIINEHKTNESYDELVLYAQELLQLITK